MEIKYLYFKIENKNLKFFKIEKSNVSILK